MQEIFYCETKALIVTKLSYCSFFSGIKQKSNKHLQTFTEYSYRKLNAKNVTVSIVAKVLTDWILLLHPRRL